MNAKTLLTWLFLVLVGCKSEPVTPAEAVKPGALTEKPVEKAEGKPAEEKAAEPSAGAPSSAATAEAKPADGKKDDKTGGLPDLEHQSGCVLFHWTTLEPSWDREELTFDAATRTLSLMGSSRHFDESGHVVDFGEGTDQLVYDKAGNLVSRGGAKKGQRTDYKYKNKYDAKGRLVSVEIAMKPLGGKMSAFAPYRNYHYDEQGRIDRMDVQVVPTGPLVPIQVQSDAQGRVVQLTWGEPNAVKEIERFHYDAAGRLTGYDRDGLVIPPGRPVTGKEDWTQTWEYRDDGLPKRLDGREAGDPDKAPHEVTLFSPGCATVGKLWPDLYVFPYMPLPAAPGSRFLGN